MQRKAYLRQNIMASHYIVAQQRRMHSSGSSCAATPTALAAAGMRDGLTLAGTPLGQGKPGGGSGGFIAAAVAAAQQAQGAPACAAPATASAQQAAQQAARAAPAIPRYHRPESGVLGCRHYRRRCMLVAPCCDKPYVCRLCHDEAEDHQVGCVLSTLVVLHLHCAVDACQTWVHCPAPPDGLCPTHILNDM